MEPIAPAKSFQVGTRRRGQDGRLWEVDLFCEGMREIKFWVVVPGSGPQPSARDEMGIVADYTEARTSR